MRNFMLMFAVLLSQIAFSQESPNSAKQKTPVHLISLTDTKSKGNQVYLNEILTRVRIVPLDGIKDFYIKEATWVKTCADKIFVFDREQNKLFIFSSAVKPLRQVLTMGKGPGEVSKAWDFDLDIKNKTLIFERYEIHVFSIQRLSYPK